MLSTIHAHGRDTMFGLVHHPAAYDRLAGRLAVPLYRRVARDVADLGLPAGARVLDVGTGPGAVPRLIAAACPDLEIDAVDLAPEMIEQARRDGGDGGAVTFSVADVAHLPWPDGTFDLVVSTLSQHHWADPESGLRDIRRVLRPGGRAWVYDVRWALDRALRAAAPLDADTSVARENRLAGTPWWNPMGRLVLRPA